MKQGGGGLVVVRGRDCSHRIQTHHIPHIMEERVLTWAGHHEAGEWWPGGGEGAGLFPPGTGSHPSHKDSISIRESINIQK
jgi:hypothetical protein